MANCENCIKSDVCKYYEPKSTVACERYSEPVKRGHWIDRTIWWGGFGQARRECSCCGTVFEGRAFSRKSGIGFKYCEECGAKMDGNEVE